MAELPEFIYRSGERVKDLALFRPLDWLTGLSFRDYPYGTKCLKLKVATLVTNGFIVRADSNTWMTQLWTEEPYFEPNSGEQLQFDEGHVSVWHSNRDFWNTWHEADKLTRHTAEVSKQLAYFALALVEILK